MAGEVTLRDTILIRTSVLAYLKKKTTSKASLMKYCKRKKISSVSGFFKNYSVSVYPAIS